MIDLATQSKRATLMSVINRLDILIATDRQANRCTKRLDEAKRLIEDELELRGHLNTLTTSTLEVEQDAR